MRSARNLYCHHGELYTVCGKCRKYRAKVDKILAKYDPSECPYCGAPDHISELGCTNCIDLQESLATLKGEDHET